MKGTREEGAENPFFAFSGKYVIPVSSPTPEMEKPDRQVIRLSST